ncbi:hypothetical protein [Amniculibacterium aquaticum]|uniref:hypothetical protein n=1 Tax=Amniculibacterium aquaticum TaxID=2479858 RepID=UPI000F5A1B10|nr:hypothetical protein [Amniculibacterium aquaticum]
MKKVITVLLIGCASLAFAKSSKSVSSINNSTNGPVNPPTLISAVIEDSSAAQGAWVWKYLYKSTCGIFFYITLDKPITELTKDEQLELDSKLEGKNLELCANAPVKKGFTEA